VNSAIEVRNKRVYRVPMRSVLLRLFATLAVILMPFGMAAAPAATSQHQQMTTAMPMQHCPAPAAPGSNGALAHCAMACSAALPAVSSPQMFAYPVVRSLPQVPAITVLSGIDPEIATPPPRTA